LAKGNFPDKFPITAEIISQLASQKRSDYREQIKKYQKLWATLFSLEELLGPIEDGIFIEDNYDKIPDLPLWDDYNQSLNIWEENLYDFYGLG